MKTVLIAILVVGLVVVAGVGGFFAGTSYGETQAQNIRSEFFRTRQGGANGQGANGGQTGQQGGGQFGRPLATGTVKSVQGNTIQVSQQDGSTVTVTMNSQTTIQKTSAGTAADLQPGTRVTVTGEQNGSDVTARVIQIRPAGQ